MTKTPNKGLAEGPWVRPSQDPSDLTFCVLASGSKGNAMYLSDGTTSVLFDAGLSGKQIEMRMAAKGLSSEDLNAIIVSHEHADHIQGIGVLSRRYKLPVYIHPKTLKAADKKIGPTSGITHFQCGTAFGIGRFKVHPFSISHDAAAPAGFSIQHGDNKIGIATDLGLATTVVKTHLQGCRLLVLEANHDMDMLIKGPYPWHLKQRIKGRMGHLSNDDAMALLAEIRHENLSHVILAHLSETNNHPEKAFRIIGQAVADKKVNLSVARQDICGDLIRLRCMG